MMDQDRLERLIAGPWKVHEGNGYTLEQLQNHRFTKHLTSGERAVCRMAAKHILEHYDLVPKKVPADNEMEVRRIIARAFVGMRGLNPDQLEPGDVYGVDGHMRNGDPAHYLWREYVDDERVKMLAGQMCSQGKLTAADLKAPAEPVMKVSALQEVVLLELASHDPETGVHTLKSLATMMVMEVRDVRLAARALARKGLATRTYLFDEYNAHIVGSGYVATAAGRSLADEINKKVNTI